jgi:Sulfotransferase family
VPKVVYIGGYGHSGSTVLEYIMAGSPAVLACGEVISSIRRGTRKPETCTCGREGHECAVWGFFYSASSNAIPWSHALILHALVHQAGNRYSALVDSSKTAWGSLCTPFRLKREFGPDFMMVHLTREPRAVCWSVLKQKNRRAKRSKRRLPHYVLRCSWVVLGWWLANLSCDLFGIIHPRHYLRLRYEDFVRFPIETLRSLYETLLPDARWEYCEPSVRDNRHQLHGNNVRYRDITISDLKEDLKWQREMPAEYSRVVSSLSYLLCVRYGYV